MSFTTLLFLLPLFHLSLALLLIGGIRRRYSRREDVPFISVVVPVRNEEASLSSLLDSLLELDYPADRMEIVLVNDESEDRTREIADSYREKFRCEYRVIDADHSREPVLTAKTLPLAQGIDVAKGDYILMTDGDCVVGRRWASTVVSYFSGEVGVVCGITLPTLEKGAGFPVTWMEAVDWSYLLGVCAGFASIGQPLALIGNNYAVSRQAYFELGTFRKMEHNAIDDIALQRAVQKSRKWKIAFPVDANSVVRTLPMGTVASQARQRRRWAKGMDIMDLIGQVIMSFAVLTHLTWPLWIVLWGWAGALAAGLIALGDGLVIATTLLRTRVRKPLWLLPFYPVYTLCYGWLMLFYLLRSRTVEWKARPFNG